MKMMSDKIVLLHIGYTNENERNLIDTSEEGKQGKVEKLKRPARNECDFENVTSEVLFSDGGEEVGIVREEGGIHRSWIEYLPILQDTGR